MNRRGFLGSLVALVVAPKTPELFPKDLCALTDSPEYFEPAEFIGYSWTVDSNVEVLPYTLVTRTWTSANDADRLRAGAVQLR